jgi:glutamate dehydrogenase/leucine dehydrogenase
MSTLISIDIDGEAQLKGYVVIDTTVNGRCHGGLRMAVNLSPPILARAARTMTLKYGFVGLPVGGAKAGIVADPEMPLDRKRELLGRFGAAIKPLLATKSYLPSGDLGVTDDDIRFMLAANDLKAQPRTLTFQLSGFYTGITVFAGAVQAASHIGLDVSRASVAIEGFGSVGSSTALAFWAKGIRVVAISTSQGAIYSDKGLDIGELHRLQQQVGSQVVKQYDEARLMDKEELLELPVDILCPCANSESITLKNASRLSARIISPGANAPFTAEAEQVLQQRGILTIPDFMANCGGVMGSTMRRAGLRENFIRHFLEHKVGDRIAHLIEAAEKEGVPLAEYAEKVVSERFLKAKQDAESRKLKNRIFNFAVELYRGGILPYQLVTPAASAYFERKLG